MSSAISTVIACLQRSADNRECRAIYRQRSGVGRWRKSVCITIDRLHSAIGGWLRERAIFQHRSAINR